MDKKKVLYFVACVDEFAKANNLSAKQAFDYLYKYKGIEFLKQYYDIEHTLSFNDAVSDLTAICKKSGGYI
ncbi:MAG: DUF3791 domain-containing protein [Endomicrobium sp.]|jgi:hypothetical protein|nr:DUF3791 domain-containing protein [Endomicrobium sp.]